jgi:hypothetical protein
MEKSQCVQSSPALGRRQTTTICSARIEAAPWKPTLIISGAARGADALGERWACEHAIPLVRMPADWDAHGRRAGYLRNLEMAKQAQALIALWDGTSRGTAHMIETARNCRWRRKRVPFWRRSGPLPCGLFGMSLSLLSRRCCQNGPEPSRARRCWARRSEPLTARTVLR